MWMYSPNKHPFLEGKKAKKLWGMDRNQSLLTAIRRETGTASCLGVQI